MALVRIGDERFAAEENEILSDVLRRAGKNIPHPCGGRGVCGKCLATVNGREVPACQYRITSDITVILPEKESIVSNLGEAGDGEAAGEPALALDIGTTTLALALVSLNEGKIIRAAAGVNPQRAFGADVMNRIGCCRANGPEPLQKAVLDAVKELLAELDAPY